MQIIKNTLSSAIFEDFSCYFNPEEVCLFDIETTGFSARHTKLYLIGCCYICDGKKQIIQWFNDDGHSEEFILEAFMDFIKSYKYLLHYNGDGFDIPYIEKKCSKFSLNNTMKQLISIDLYKKLKPFKEFMHLDNLKLKSIEQFLGIYREDKYSGGDLINIYNDYLKCPSEEAFDLLMLHNYEDLEGLFDCFQMLALETLIRPDFTINNLYVKNNNLCFELKIPVNMPKRIIYSSKGIVISIYKNNIVVSVPIIEGILKRFYDNPTEYYYLPSEDRAIHKSVATYVDKSHRIKATRENCYCNTEGIFITQLEGTLTPSYKNEYNDKESYIMLIDSFLDNQTLLYEYITIILKQMIRK